MRVYIAIDFDDNVKEYFQKITLSIIEHCSEGTFTEKNNFHLTIKFIGEADELKIDKIKEIMDKAVLNINPFDLLVNDLGIFKRKRTNILWIGLENNNVLSDLHKDLSTLLREYKLPFYDKLYIPHITLGRRVELAEGFTDFNSLIQFEKINIPVMAITLMASKQIDGKLNGVPIYMVNLK